MRRMLILALLSVVATPAVSGDIAGLAPPLQFRLAPGRVGDTGSVRGQLEAVVLSPGEVQRVRPSISCNKGEPHVLLVAAGCVDQRAIWRDGVLAGPQG